MTQQSESQAMAHEATLFVMQMAGDSMINAGIHNGDLLIVDRSLAPVPGDVVAAVMDDEIAIKRLVSRAGITILHAENPRYPDYMPSNGASPAIWGIVTDVNLEAYPFILTVDGDRTVEAESLIVATGASAKYLGLPSENKFKGMGVSACATCDGFFYRGQDVAVVGGGDTAAEEASYLANICNKVYMIVRRNELRACHVMQKRVKENPKIEILFEHQTKEVLGDDNGVNGVIVVNTKGEERRLDITGFFLAIGHKPNTDLFRGKLDLNPEGYIVTRGNTSHTSVNGVFAAGDVRDPRYRQAIVAAGSGCMAAMDCEKYLMLGGDI